jgi:hypothetical protein
VRMRPAGGVPASARAARDRPGRRKPLPLIMIRDQVSEASPRHADSDKLQAEGSSACMIDPSQVVSAPGPGLSVSFKLLRLGLPALGARASSGSLVIGKLVNLEITSESVTVQVCILTPAESQPEWSPRPRFNLKMVTFPAGPATPGCHCRQSWCVGPGPPAAVPVTSCSAGGCFRPWPPRPLSLRPG